jgi:hypothetical protein
MQFVEQRLGLFQIEHVEAFGEPVVDRSEKLASITPLSLIASESRYAHSGAEFPRFRPLLTRDGESALEIGLRFSSHRGHPTSPRFRRRCDGPQPPKLSL